jgi:hypothetical protein
LNVASWFSSYRLLEARIAELQDELRQEKAKSGELLNKVLTLAKVTPMFYEPPKAVEQAPPPPIGPSAKRAQLQMMRQNETVKSEEEILEAARKAANGNGNHA